MTAPARLAGSGRWLAGRVDVLSVAALAALAYIPALLSSPGRMPADTKLYLYLDPGGLVGRAPSTFEPDQFAGWVPHQQITYLWPSGPWFGLGELAGLPDWVTHRLWIATIMFAAGCGVLWTARRLGLRGAAPLVAALLYQCSPFLLPYISRTSLLLLPWAGLGWIVALTIGATSRRPDAAPEAGWRQRLTVWREPAAIALIVATVGSANATALALVAPAPVLWLVHAAWSRLVTWRAALVLALRIGGACLAVSLWWIAMLLVQARHGAPVLAYSETLADVSGSATGSEVLRGLGYWLFYVRDPFGPTTTASLDYLISTRAIAVSFAVTLVGLAGIVLTSSPFRRFAALLVATGAVLAVGVHPIGSPSPLMSLIADDDESGIALALRSSTRAGPLLLLGLALGAASLVAAIPARRLARRAPSWVHLRPLGALAVAVLLVANLPALWRFELVDDAIDRDQRVPAAWTDAAQVLDAGRPDARVLQLPGAEFGAFRWGYTVDQPLVGLSDRPLVTRDLLPLGSAPAMDLLYALDDRFQDGTAEPASVAPVARLLGANTIWIANDIEFERFRTPRPELVDAALTGPDAAGSGDVRRFGEAVVNAPSIPMIDAVALADDRVGSPIEPVVLVGIEEAPGVVRTKHRPVVLAGSGDGVVDAAAAGVLSGHELLLYSAGLDPAERSALIAGGTPLVVTDSNRDRAHHWRGSQDVHGHTEPGGPGADVLVDTNADQRLDVFPTDDPALQTVAIQEGPVGAIASSYGEPFAYLPEHRAVMAIDGDPATAWLVGGHGDPVGERIRLSVAETVPSIALRQPEVQPGGRQVAAVRITVDGRAHIELPLTDGSAAADGRPVGLPAPATETIEVEIIEVTAGDPLVAASRAPVGFVEIDVGLGPTTELIRPPAAALAAAGGGPLAIVLSRLRVDPLDRWRSDPEPRLIRVFDLGAPATLEASVTLRLDRRSADAIIAATLGDAPAVVADRRLTGAARHRGVAAVDGDPATAWITPFDGAIGATLTIETTEPVGPELVVTQPAGELATIAAITVGDGVESYDVTLPAPDAAGRSAFVLPSALAAGVATLTITATDGSTTIDRRFGDRVALPAAIAELSGPGVPVHAPLAGDTPVVATCRDDLVSLDGRPLALSFETTVDGLLDGGPVEATPCDGPLALDGGQHRITSTPGADTGLSVDRVVLRSGGSLPATAADSEPASIERDDARHRVVTTGGCPTECWLVFGEGFNDAWSASIDGTSLGPPTLVDGGFNGWRLPAGNGPVTVDLEWTAQRPVTVGLVLSGLAVVLAVAVVAAGRRTPVAPLASPTLRWRRRPGRRRAAIVAAVALVVTSALCIGPVWGAIALVPALASIVAVRAVDHPVADRLIELAGLAAAVLVALGAVVIERRNSPRPDLGWIESFERLNGLALFAVIAIGVGVAAMSGGHGTDRPS